MSYGSHGSHGWKEEVLVTENLPLPVTSSSSSGFSIIKKLSSFVLWLHAMEGIEKQSEKPQNINRKINDQNHSLLVMTHHSSAGITEQDFSHCP